jgi:hypothetical protein
MPPIQGSVTPIGTHTERICVSDSTMSEKFAVIQWTELNWPTKLRKLFRG